MENAALAFAVRGPITSPGSASSFRIPEQNRPCHVGKQVVMWVLKATFIEHLLRAWPFLSVLHCVNSLTFHKNLMTYVLLLFPFDS